MSELGTAHTFLSKAAQHGFKSPHPQLVNRPLLVFCTTFCVVLTVTAHWHSDDFTPHKRTHRSDTTCRVDPREAQAFMQLALEIVRLHQQGTQYWHQQRNAGWSLIIHGSCCETGVQSLLLLNSFKAYLVNMQPLIEMVCAGTVAGGSGGKQCNCCVTTCEVARLNKYDSFSPPIHSVQD